MRGIADLVFNPLQLDDGLFFRSWRHPTDSLNIVLHGMFDVMHHFERPRPALRRKSAIDISLAEGLTQITVGALYAAAPPRLIFFLAGECVGKEIEILV